MTGSQFLDVSEDGIAAGHPRRVERPRLVAPSLGEEFNTVQPQLFTVGCALLPDHQFEFDSSFIAPGADKSFRKLVRLCKAHPECPLSVFGHADPVGRDEYNKKLSGRRAMAVYGVLVRDVELWEQKLYKRPHGGDDWGTRSIQIMLNTLGFPPGEIDGVLGSDTRDAVEAFQTANAGELAVDRDPGPNTRKKLYELYMDHLCSDDGGVPFKLEPTDFLAQGADADGKADYQGCGEYNPVLLFSRPEQEEFDRTENRDARNAANAPNRRVVVFLYRRGSKVDPAHWPCPPAKDSTGRDCKKRFWSDGEDRRSRLLEDERREFQSTEDTFACRFYHGFAEFSPCEAALKLWIVRLQVDGPNGERIPLERRRFAVTAGDSASAPVLRGTTDDNGILRIPAFDDAADMTLKLDVSGYLFEDRKEQDSGDGDQQSAADDDVPPEDEWENEDRFMQFALKCGALLPLDSEDPAPVRQRLHNLGFGPSAPDDWDEDTTRAAIKAFQRRHDLTDSGEADEQTRTKLEEVHGS